MQSDVAGSVPRGAEGDEGQSYDGGGTYFNRPYSYFPNSFQRHDSINQGEDPSKFRESGPKDLYSMRPPSFRLPSTNLEHPVPQQPALPTEPLTAPAHYVLWLIRTSGFIAAVFTVIVGLCRLPFGSLSLEWPTQGFLADDNAATWRMTLFSFTPDVLIDVWTPLVWGLASLMIHFEEFDTPPITGHLVNFFFWNLIQALWANMGYAGGLGIIVGCISLSVSVLCLLGCIVRIPAHVSLRMKFPSFASYKIVGAPNKGSVPPPLPPMDNAYPNNPPTRTDSQNIYPHPMPQGPPPMNQEMMPPRVGSSVRIGIPKVSGEF